MSDRSQQEQPQRRAREMHISKAARERYGLDDLEVSADDGGVLSDLRMLRALVEVINRRRDVVRFPERGVSAGALNAVGRIDALWRHLVDEYREGRHEGVLDEAVEWLAEQHGTARLERAMQGFLDLFPAGPVRQEEVDAAEYLDQVSDGVPHRQRVLEELLFLWWANHNPAFEPLRDWFDDDELQRRTGYRELVESLPAFFDKLPPAVTRDDTVARDDTEDAEDADLTLLDQLWEPVRRAPSSLSDQLRYWVDSGWLQLPPPALAPVLVAVDVLREEEKPFHGHMGAAPGPPSLPPPVPDFLRDAEQPERFSEDRDWMPEVVLLAKNTYVWLHQLSVEYDVEIRQLDHIPDAELERLASRGFDTLWLIGIWERSDASRRIKQLCGNPEAVSSAYSLRAYRIADALGGDDAWDDLRRRAEAYGIRLACDMVPNHTGLDSDWLVRHPERFLSLPQCPYPGYTFSGEDLCDDPGVEVRIEDHYFDRTDAAVVFERRDVQTGERRYVYHGNDGTSIPWNDTAQLDYLDAATREAVIDTIVEVARRFSVIRFDAAMTLAKRHIQRLWYPRPGQGGAIPSRAEHSIPDEVFEQRIPEEFWRQVVERVAREAPDTLLLAEAFWLMESYFVRTLGMHRVYNSAFMHMLRDEDNAEFRLTLSKTLEFDPEVLQRHVNYLTTPDEESAAAQFGVDGKYFCACTLMVTLPGLPMFGHGQFEGLREKYGMEYARSYSAEAVDAQLLERHRREIVPLLHLRQVFAEVEHFRLYDFETPDGVVDENVFVLSNRTLPVPPSAPQSTSRSTSQVTPPSTPHDVQQALVFVHNAPTFTQGRAHRAVAWRSKRGGQGGALLHTTLGEALAVRPQGSREGMVGEEGDGACRRFLLARDVISGREYLRPSDDVAMQGFELHLGPYERRVLVGLREVLDVDGRYEALWRSIGVQGVDSLDGALAELKAAPVQEPLRELLASEPLRRFWLAGPDLEEGVEATLEGALRSAYLQVQAKVQEHAGTGSGTVPSEQDVEAAVAQVVERLERLRALTSTVLQRGNPALQGRDPALQGGKAVETESLEPLDALLRLAPAPSGSFALLIWIVFEALGHLGQSGEDDSATTDSANDVAETTRDLIVTWRLTTVAQNALRDLGVEEAQAQHQAAAIAVMAGRGRWWRDFDLHTWLQRAEVRQFLGVNRFDDVVWFGKEACESLCWWLAATALVLRRPGTESDADLIRAARQLERLQAAAAVSGYRLLDWLDAISAAPDMPPQI